jgi:protein O-GlcNAc transferase
MSRKASDAGSRRAEGPVTQVNAAQLMGLAAASMSRGHWAEAEQICRRVLESRAPGAQAEALHMLGLVAANTARLPEAATLLSRAARQAPDDAVIHFNHGNVLGSLGRSRDALTSYARALRVDPHMYQAHNNSGNELLKLDRLEESLASCERAIALEPRCAEAHNTRAGALLSLGRLAEAMSACDEALSIDPNLADAHCTRGFVLASLGRPQDALTSFAMSLSLRPQQVQALQGRAEVQLSLGLPEEAIESCTLALRLQPDADIHVTRAIALRMQRRHADALLACEQALQLQPQSASAYNTRGVILQDVGRATEALQSYERACKLDPDYADAYRNRAGTLLALKRQEEAVCAFKRALALSPRYPWLRGTLLFSQLQVCDWVDFDDRLADLLERIARNEQVVQPFAALALADSPAIQRRVSEIWSSAALPQQPTIPDAPRPAGARIRVGYFSADLHDHATAHLAAGLFERHDRQVFEIVAFSFGAEIRDGMRERLASGFDRFIDVRQHSDAEIARIAREMQVDIAVDLKGFTHEERSGIFGHRAAPVQVSYLGYPGTLGLANMDYLVADHTLIPPQSRPEYHERIVYLPDSYQVNDRRRSLPDMAPSRASLGLPEDVFVFCCFNNAFKILPAVFDSWMRILQATTESVLWLLVDSEAATVNLQREAKARGVDPGRLVFARRAAHAEHLARNLAADLFLDTLPYNAHTTASDALWCGLPVLTRMGESFPARVTASLLKAVGCPELITASREEYEELAIRLATDRPMLNALRERLHEQRDTAPLFDTDRFTANLERAYRVMHQRRLAGLAPEDILLD